MQTFKHALILLLLCGAVPAQADLLSPVVEAARERLSNNPKTYDRADQFCKGKDPQEACVIPFSPLVGGGEGICKNYVNRRTETIDISCVVTHEPQIDRQLPPGGFVGDRFRCPVGVAHQYNPDWSCTPLPTPPIDRFCKDLPVGSACTNEFQLNGKTEHEQGVCKQVTEKQVFEPHPHDVTVTTREVIRCEPTSRFKQEYSNISWWQKLLR